MTSADPTDLPDGCYVASVQLVDRGWVDRAGRGRALLTLAPPDGDDSEAGTHWTSLTALDPPVAPDTVYRVEIRGGRLQRAEHDWQATVRATAQTVPAEELVVPLRRVDEREGTVAANPAMVRLDPSSSVLVAGEPGAGKTEFVKSLCHQLRANPDEPVVVFNYKDDYSEFAERMAEDRVVRLSTRDSTDVWNVFREVESEEGFDRIGRSLFKRREEDANTKKFFPITARQVFVTTLKYLSREGERSGLVPDNRELVDFYDRFSAAEIYELVGEHDDLAGAVEAMNPEASKQSIGVVGTLQSVLRDTIALGDFARPNGTFSIREYFENPDGRVLLLDYPLEEGDRVTDLFRVFLDRAIQYALADGDTQATFVLDEFARIPHVDRMKTLVATGRARSIQSVVGVQSVAQLAENYGDDAADSFLSGLTQEVLLRAGDERTLDYYASRLGVRSTSRDRTADRPALPTDDPDRLRNHLQRLDDGEGYVIKQDGYAHVSIPMLSQLDPSTRAVIRDRRRDRDRPRERSR
jgi:hypothetical protein